MKWGRVEGPLLKIQMYVCVCVCGTLTTRCFNEDPHEGRAADR